MYNFSVELLGRFELAIWSYSFNNLCHTRIGMVSYYFEVLNKLSL